jgi:hypothetical protein
MIYHVLVDASGEATQTAGGAGASSVTQITTNDGVSLHVEETGNGPPILFIHEFAGDARSWAPQVNHFSA